MLLLGRGHLDRMPLLGRIDRMRHRSGMHEFACGRRAGQCGAAC